MGKARQSIIPLYLYFVFGSLIQIINDRSVCDFKFDNIVIKLTSLTLFDMDFLTVSYWREGGA